VADLNVSLETRGQFAAIAQLRWRMFVNSLRTNSGKAELGFRIFASTTMGLGGLGASIGLGVGAYSILASHANAEWLAVLLWIVFLGWQLIPIFTSTLASGADSSSLLRFPLSFPGYVAVQLAYGSVDIATGLGCLALTGITVGVGIARPSLLLWTALTLAVFAVGNILLARTVFAWIERWLAQRKTRELMGALFILLALSFQLVGPMMSHLHHKSSARFVNMVTQILPEERLLPPGLAARSIAMIDTGHFPIAVGFLGLLFAYELSICGLLMLRLRAQFRGENLSEAPAKRGGGQRPTTSSKSASSKLASGPIAAIVEKELNYLRRSPPILFTLITPVFMLVVFGSARSPFLRAGTGFLFPIGVAYSLLTIVNLAYNCFATDAGGIQIYFTSPVPMRRVITAKNIACTYLIGLQLLILWIVVTLFFRAPSIDVLVATLAWILFAAPLNFAVGNLVSIYFPKKIDLARFGRQKGSAASGFIGLGLQAVTVGIGVLTFALLRLYGSVWLAIPIFALCAGASIGLYLLILNRVDQMAFSRREALITELCRA
jgi:ABC-2 type transport system permease protein